MSCDVLEVADFPEYPTKIESLPLEELVLLNQKYIEENEGYICSPLNEFGFTGFSRVLFPNDENPCLTRDVVRSELVYSDSLLDIVKRSLLRNAEYTNVTDTTALEVTEIIPLYGCTICEGQDENSVPLEYKFTFDVQKFEATEVRNSEITVVVDSIGVNRILGNWYPKFESPGLINIGYIDAQKIMIGWEINMEPLIGEKLVFIVEEEHLNEIPEFEYMPFINEQVLELRKTWKVPISYKDETFEGWYANVDVIDGLLLSVEPINSSQ
tara:strand:+ start:6041 stop:6847 length:807 start_codon:yes stop_codon:yes gene_type:complete